jgi:hypothetical protein
LILVSASGIGNGDDHIGSGGVDVQTLEDLAHSGEDSTSTNISKCGSGGRSDSCGIRSEDCLVDNETVHCQLNVVLLLVDQAHSEGRGDRAGTDRVWAIEETEFHLDGSTHSESNEGHFSSEENGVIVAVFSSIVLEVNSL